ncbi:Fic family protein [Luteibacter jiangsuensis]|uniref:Fic family protein n=1 Tax=Luteibacter jiangsuensis TaxID=637577 RepID=A0ABT9SVU2_9GAMM|nr:Fic family protein [Luteibacter jiangsuensis]MDQ0009119.1 Fic family protein [Luteibacter jiangsuensis]
MNDPSWIWQRSDWPAFRWQEEAVAPLLRACQLAQGRLLGAAGAVDADLEAGTELDALLQNVVASSAIEGEDLDVGSVRSSLARRLGLDDEVSGRRSARSEGLAELTLDATRNYRDPLDLPRLLHWHTYLFPKGGNILPLRIRIGALRGEEPMQVVSGRMDKPRVHFQAPPRSGLENQVDAFLDWFSASRENSALDPLLRAGIAHLWFVTLHPFDDGNGRMTRALTDLALAQAEHQAIRFYTMATSILDDRGGYYDVLEASQRAGLDITSWLEWFLRTLLRSLELALAHIDRVMGKSRFWREHRTHELSAEQVKVLNRLLDGGDRGFPQGISASQYQAVAKVSKATATRHLGDLLDKGMIVRLPGGGRSTRYRIAWPSTGIADTERPDA